MFIWVRNYKVRICGYKKILGQFYILYFTSVFIDCYDIGFTFLGFPFQNNNSFKKNFDRKKK